MKKNTVQFNLLSVREDSFYIDEKPLKGKEEQPIGFNFNYKVKTDANNNIVQLNITIKEMVESELMVDCSATFIFIVKELASFITTNGEYSEIKDVMPHILNVAIGTMRGIIVARTSGTALANFPLPVVSIEEVIRLSKRSTE